jgi:hypothetical protein
VLVSERPRDVAILWIDPSVTAGISPLALPCPPTPGPTIDDGDEIVTIAVPHAREKDLVSGEVTALRPRAVEADLRLSFGEDGGPVFNEAGTLIGLSSVSVTDDVRRGADVNVVRAVFLCEALAASLPNLSGAAPPPPTPLPIEPTRSYPADALDRKGPAGAATPIMLSSASFDVALLTPPVVRQGRDRSTWTGGRGARTTETEARLGQLTEFGSWSDYFSDHPAVLIVRVTPKLVEGFWKRLGREAARTQGAVLPPFKDFTTSFGRMRLTCDGAEAAPLHPFVLEHRVSEKNTIREGLYVFQPDAIGPHCVTVTITISPESSTDRSETLTINRPAVDRIWQDFEPHRAIAK